jgi:hypothetical protein
MRGFEMALYQLLTPDPNGPVLRTADHVSIPPDPDNRDYAEYQQWVADGGVPDPYKKPPPAPPDTAAIVGQSYRAGLLREADQLQAQGKNYDALKLLLKATS